MKRKLSITIFLLICLFFINSNIAEATPADTSFKDDYFYKSVITQLNTSNVGGKSDRTVEYVPTDDELAAITTLTCGSNSERITDLAGLERMPNLKTLKIYYPFVTSLDITRNTNLEYFYLVNADRVDEIDFSKNTKLQIIELTYTGLKHLDVSQCPNLTQLSMGKSSYSSREGIEYPTEIDLTHNPKLQRLVLSITAFKKIDLSKNPELTEVRLTTGKLEEVILPDNPKLTILSLYGNNISNVENIKNLSKCTKLRTLYLFDNQLSAVLPFPDVTNASDVRLSGNISTIELNSSEGTVELATILQEAQRSGSPFYSASPLSVTVTGSVQARIDGNNLVYTNASGGDTIKIEIVSGNASSMGVATYKNSSVTYKITGAGGRPSNTVNNNITSNQISNNVNKTAETDKMPETGVNDIVAFFIVILIVISIALYNKNKYMSKI